MRSANSRVITLTTDFGTADWFVGVLKGVALSITPGASIVDITHEVPPGDIRSGAFALMASFAYFPEGTVHVAVVDPGVGSKRRALAVQTERGYFVGPDNGVLSWALARQKVKSIRQLQNPDYFLKPLSRTFHGRDVFSPVAAHLSRGLPIENLGPERPDFIRLPWPALQISRGETIGEIVYIDRFGNAITNIDAPLLSTGSGACEVIGPPVTRFTAAEFYGAVPFGQSVAVIGSSGFLELAINGGSAAEKFGLRSGQQVRLKNPKRGRE